MILSDSERDHKIDSFLSRKFKEFDLEQDIPSVREVQSFGKA